MANIGELVIITRNNRLSISKSVCTCIGRLSTQPSNKAQNNQQTTSRTHLLYHHRARGQNYNYKQ